MLNRTTSPQLICRRPGVSRAPECPLPGTSCLRPSTCQTATGRRVRRAPCRPAACGSSGCGARAYASPSSPSVPSRAAAPSTSTPQRSSRRPGPDRHHRDRTGACAARRLPRAARRTQAQSSQQPAGAPSGSSTPNCSSCTGSSATPCCSVSTPRAGEPASSTGSPPTCAPPSRARPGCRAATCPTCGRSGVPAAEPVQRPGDLGRHLLIVVVWEQAQPNVKYVITCAGSLPSERRSRTPHTTMASSTAFRGTAFTSTPTDT
jgi:hypothetical protein